MISAAAPAPATSFLSRVAGQASSNRKVLILMACVAAIAICIVAYYYYCSYIRPKQQQQQLCQGSALFATPYCQRQLAKASAKHGTYSMVTTIRPDVSLTRSATGSGGGSSSSTAAGLNYDGLDHDGLNYDGPYEALAAAAGTAPQTATAVEAGHKVVAAQSRDRVVVIHDGDGGDGGGGFDEDEEPGVMAATEPFVDQGSSSAAGRRAGAQRADSTADSISVAAAAAAASSDHDLDADFRLQGGAAGRVMNDEDRVGVSLLDGTQSGTFADKLHYLDFTDKTWAPPRVYDERFDAILSKGGEAAGILAAA